MEPVLTALLVLAIGLVAGVVGGLSGIGGSIIMLPALGFTLGYRSPDQTEHHLYMAAAMAVNAVVAGASTREHLNKGLIRWPLVRWLLPTMIGGIIGGVFLSGAFGAAAAKVTLGWFTLAFCVHNVRKALTSGRAEPPAPTPSRRRVQVVGGITGLGSGVAAGFMGIGGGVVVVPALTVSGVATPKQAVATSACVMMVSSVVGASLKLALLDREGLSWVDALVLAAPMGLGAVIGAPLGAMASHRLPTRWLRVAISAVLAASGAKLAGLF